MMVIISPNELRIDGENVGSVFDSVANLNLNIPDVQRAFIAYVEALAAEKESAIASQKAAGDAALEAAALVLAETQQQLAAAQAINADWEKKWTENIAYQTDVLTRAAVEIPKAIETGDFAAVGELLVYAGKEFEAKKREQEVAALEADEAALVKRREELGI